MRVWTVILLCLVARPVMAQSYSALELESWCKFIDTAPCGLMEPSVSHPLKKAGFCWGAFAMISQLITADDRGDRPLKICAPPKHTPAQIVKIFMRYVDRHPEEAHLPFALVANYALTEAFPCAFTSQH